MVPTRIVGLFAINGLAFGLAEILGAVAPQGAEPLSVLALAVLGMAAIAVPIGWTYATVYRRLPAHLRQHSWLGRLLHPSLAAFAPGTLLLLPKLRIAVQGDPAPAFAWLATVVLVSLALFGLAKHGANQPEGNRADPAPALSLNLAAYGVVSLAIWFVGLRIKDLATVAESKSQVTVLPFGTWLLVVAVGLLAAAAAVFLSSVGWRRPGKGLRVGALLAIGLFVALLGWRWLSPPHYFPRLEPVAERLGRGTPVILIVLDTVRADHLSVYGYSRDTSPELEELARDAVVYEHALAVSSWTLPSHASLFTGLFPLTHGALRLPGLDEDSAALAERRIHRPAYPLSESYPTLAEWFLERGYGTGAMVANYAYLDPAFQVDQGFETYFSVRNTPVEPRLLRVIDRRVARLPGMARHWQVYRSAGQINELARDFLEAQESPRFFLFLNFMEAHLPWGPHQPGLRYESYASEPSLPPPAGSKVAPEETRWRRRVDLYDSNLASLDQRLGELFDRLREMGLYDSSLIVVTADHGESFGENDFDGHGKSLNEAEVWVPLIIKYPGSRQTGRSADPVQLVDLLPTIIREVGRAHNQELEFGHNIEGEPLGQVAHPLLAELYTDPRESDEAFHGYRAALWQGDRKLVVRSDEEHQLFLRPHLEVAVPMETAWLPWVLTQESRLLERWRGLEKLAKERQEDAELDPEVEAGLEALGYL